MALAFKKIFAWMVIFAGCAGFIFFGFQLITSNSIQNAIKKNFEIEAAFQDATYFVDTYKLLNYRLPTREEFERRPLSQRRSPVTKNNFESAILLGQSANPLPESMGPVPADSYYLSVWRGDGEEFYTPWNKKSSLIFEEDQYYLLRSKKLTWFAMGFYILMSLFGIYLLHRVQKHL